MFIDSTPDLDQLTEVIADYVNFCVDLNIPTKQVKIFANNKPWITKDVKSVINRKKKVFHQRGPELKALKNELRHSIRHQRKLYKDKIEQNFTQSNMKKVWQGMKFMSGYTSKNNSSQDFLAAPSSGYANELNLFYNRFDCHDFSENITELKTVLCTRS